VSAPKRLGVPYLPSVHAKNYAEFSTMLAETRPTRAKRVDFEGGLLVTTETRRVYFRATANALRALRAYGVEVDADPPPFTPSAPKPAAHPRTLGEFCEHLEKHKPTAAKIIDSSCGAMLVYCDEVNVYFQNTPHARRALRHYGVKP
jgi:hypothetical protein